MKKWLFPVLFLLVLGVPAAVSAQCSGGAEETGEMCGELDHIGCCKDGDLYFCEGKALCKLTCEKMPECGWREDKGYYDCATEGAPDPSGIHPLQCPAENNCLGVNYRGCCVSDTVYWCADNQLSSMDCPGNDTKTACGLVPESGAANCVEPEFAGTAPVCPFAQTGADITIPDIPPADVVDESTEEDQVSGEIVIPDIVIPTDDIEVPDVVAPDECNQLVEKYVVVQSDCEEFGLVFFVKQEGCVAVLAGLTPGKSAHPIATVTKQSVSFGIPESTIAKQCAAEFTDFGMQGNCFWMGGDKCAFRFQDPDYVPPKPEEDTKGGTDDPGSNGDEKESSGGCSAHSTPQATTSALFWLMGLGLVLVLCRRRSCSAS